MNQSSMEKDALQQRYDELSRALRSQLNRSLLLTKAYKKEVSTCTNTIMECYYSLRNENSKEIRISIVF